MSAALSILKKVYALLTGYVQFSGRLDTIEADLKVVKEHVLVQNTEMGTMSVEQTRLATLQGGQDTRLDRIAEDVSYIRGRLDARP